jgi:protein-S-isoprenylcysteine O-methyltransferase Ste14
MKGSIYIFHGLFWSVFLLRSFRNKEPAAATEPAPATATVHKTRRAWPALLVHSLGFGLMYMGVNAVVFTPHDVPRLFDVSPAIGASVILLGAAIFGWALLVFESWRILAKLDEGHRLCTRGPFRFVRNPIYLACDLLALGSFLWIPNVATLAGVLFMHLGGELRARAEEKLLAQAFGDEYGRYRAATGRFFPKLV